MKIFLQIEKEWSENVGKRKRKNTKQVFRNECKIPTARIHFILMENKIEKKSRSIGIDRNLPTKMNVLNIP